MDYPRNVQKQAAIFIKIIRYSLTLANGHSRILYVIAAESESKIPVTESLKKFSFPYVFRQHLRSYY